MIVPNNSNAYLPPVIQIPSALEITAISQSYPVVVTANANSDQMNAYIAGQNVILTVPITWGMFQVNKRLATILSINGNQLSLNIDSSQFDPFSDPDDGTIATLAPSGSTNLQYNNSTAQVAFQSLNNIGN
jgi:hypothetical protein